MENVGPDGMTAAERHALWRSEGEKFELRFSSRKAENYHTRCRDCGVYLKKSRWIQKDSYNATQHQQRPLCSSCWNEYDYP